MVGCCSAGACFSMISLPRWSRLTHTQRTVSLASTRIVAVRVVWSTDRKGAGQGKREDPGGGRDGRLLLGGGLLLDDQLAALVAVDPHAAHRLVGLDPNSGGAGGLVDRRGGVVAVEADELGVGAQDLGLGDLVGARHEGAARPLGGGLQVEREVDAGHTLKPAAGLD